MGHVDVGYATAVYLTTTPTTSSRPTAAFRPLRPQRSGRACRWWRPSLGSLVQSSFIDHLPVQKGLRVGSVRSYRDTIRMFLCFVSGRRRDSIALINPS